NQGQEHSGATGPARNPTRRTTITHREHVPDEERQNDGAHQVEDERDYASDEGLELRRIKGTQTNGDYNGRIEGRATMPQQQRDEHQAAAQHHELTRTAFEDRDP